MEHALLIVEDQRRIAAYVKRGLEEEGYAVDVAADGREALDWAFGVAFDVTVLDLLLPGLDGLTVCREPQTRRQDPDPHAHRA